MEIIDIREAEIHPSRLVDDAIQGKSFISAQAGMGADEIAARFGTC